MKPSRFHLSLLLPVIMIAAACVGSDLPATAQQSYHNIQNQPFRTVGDGPQSAIIVDVADPNDEPGVRRAVDARVRAMMQARRTVLEREVQFLRRHYLLRADQKIPVVDTVLIRSHGRLVTADPKKTTRAAGGNITYVANPAGNFAFDAPTAAAFDSITNSFLYPALKNRIGAPFWNGTVTILNKDDNPTQVSGILGVVVVINGSSVSIDLPQFRAAQDTYLGLIQAMAQTFHGTSTLGYDAWEVGMARAAAVVVAHDLNGQFPNIQGGTIDPAASFYYTPLYDVLNQPALGNNTFLPPTKSAQTLSGFGGMLVPRLQTSSTAWLKCFIENPGFLANFNSAYFDAVTADATVRSDVNRLRGLASQAVGGTVEGQPFDTWFQQQYVFDTSVAPGQKNYVYAQPTPPDATHPEDGAGVIELAYQTTATGDEIDSSGTSYPIFYDNTFANRLTLSGGDAPVLIANGEGTTAPYFTNIGSPPTMRITMDFPFMGTSQRIFFPANEATTGTAANLTFNDFYGVVVGSDTGTLTATFTGGDGSPVTTPIVQGAFGIVGGAHAPTDNFTRATLSYQPATGQPIVFHRNVYQRIDNVGNTGLSNVSSVFVLNVPGPSVVLTHVFNGGVNIPQLISLPIQPFNPDMAGVFGTPPASTLVAEWVQSAAPPAAVPNDHYVRYPNLPPYQPGYGLWTGFPSALNGGANQNGVSITGVPTDNQPRINVQLQYGWNLIGTPFNANVSLLSDGTTGNNGGVTISYGPQGNDAVLLTDAVLTNKWVGAGVFGFDPKALSYVDITQATPTGGFTSNVLEPWKGYWILVTVPEGVTLTYVNPNPNIRSAVASGRLRRNGQGSRAVASRPRDGWRLPLTVRDDEGNAAAAQIGQSAQGSDRYVSSLDAAMPPAFTRTAGLTLRMRHPDWSLPSGSGDFLSDVRRSATSATWNVTVDLPSPGRSYSLAWGATARLPRGLNLTLIDLGNGTRKLMNSGASYSFTSSPGETSRQFHIEVDPATAANLTVMNLRVESIRTRAGAGASAATITYSLSRAAEATLQIRGLGGRIVRRLAAGRAVSTGLNREVWDLRDDRGIVLPTGLYQIELLARTPDGRQTRVIQPHQIIR